MKYLFYNDYSEGAHLNIIRTLEKSNDIQEAGYGLDSFCTDAANQIKKILKNEKVDIHFVSGGTQANLLILSAMMKPYESVVCANTGHINVHEAGAIEATGHKVESIISQDGKLTAAPIKDLIDLHNDEHMTKPRVVFISNSTEVGTIYSKEELISISKLCKQENLYLYMDGARIGSALCSNENDLSLEDIAGLVDAFYIGGTKNGALLGEAIVICNQSLQQDFRYYIKQRGALLAKGRVIGIQFQELFKDNLYFDLATHANAMANKLTDSIKTLGIRFLTNSSTNQIFPILPNTLIKSLSENYGFYIWEKVSDTESCIRLVTSWATKEEAVSSFISDLKSLTEKNLLV